MKRVLHTSKAAKSVPRSRRRLPRNHRSMGLPGQNASGAPRGYTLLELLLVLVVLVVAGSIITPVVVGLYERSTLQEAARQLAADLASTRLAAIDAGVPYRFQIEIGGRAYSAEPAEPIGPGASDPAPERQTLAGELPEDIAFAMLADQPVLQSPLTPPQSAASQGGTTLATVFLADGSAIDAAFEIVNADENRVRFDIRGLTGAVRVGDVEGRPER